MKKIHINLRLIHILLYVVIISSSINVYAQDYFDVDGITYVRHAKSSNNATIIRCDTNKISSEFTIPSTVTYEGCTYKVIAISQDAFWSCKRLTSIIIQDGILYIALNPQSTP